MEMPVENIVSEIDLKPSDVWLPLFECVVNSIISLIQTKGIKKQDKKIQIQIERGRPSANPRLIDNANTVKSITVIDNGEGFTDENLISYKTAYSRKNKKDFGCKGVGRFTILAAFSKINVVSVYKEGKTFKSRAFEFDTKKEITESLVEDSEVQKRKTTVSLTNWHNEALRDYTAITVKEIAEDLMNHCLIYFLCGNLPNIEILDKDTGSVVFLKDLFNEVSEEREKKFTIAGNKFRCYVTRTEKRNNHYLHYCANSRVVGRGKSLSNVDSLFSYPIEKDNVKYLLDAYVVSDYLNKKVYNTRNGFSIPQEQENTLGLEVATLSFSQIEQKITELLEEEYKDFVKETRNRSVKELINYIKNKAPRYTRYINRPKLLAQIPANISDDKKEEYLNRIAYAERKRIETKIQDFVKNKQVNAETIENVKTELKEKALFDSDNLSDYMLRRKAVIDVFKKFLDADAHGHYKLEEDIHNLIFPTGLTNDQINYEAHNLWLLDERFAAYNFIASDKPITSFSQKKSSKEPDILLMESPPMFDNPISFAPSPSGELQSLVIFEFKRPGETAWQKSKSNFQWEFSELIMKYFDDFLYKPDKKNYKGNHVVVNENTPKYGYLVMDVIPTQLINFNKGRGFRKTPFGTYYKIFSELNLHIEVLTFRKLIEAVEMRHAPFFDKLFNL